MRRLFEVFNVLRPTPSSREEAEEQAAEELRRATAPAEPGGPPGPAAEQ